jgi:hypothetical protein
MTNSPTSYWDAYDFFHRRSKTMLAAVADLILPKVQEGIQSGGLKNLAPVCTEQHIQYPSRMEEGHRRRIREKRSFN